MIKQIIFILFTLLLVACAPNRALKHFEKEHTYAKAIQHTKKCDIVDENQLKVMFTATYLNSVDSKWNNDKESFIISVFVVDSKNNRPFYNNQKYEIDLNEKKNSFLKPLSKEHILFENIPLYNAWAPYFMLKFDSIDEDEHKKVISVNSHNNVQRLKEETIDPYILNLRLTHATLGSCTISFPKQ